MTEDQVVSSFFGLVLVFAVAAAILTPRKKEPPAEEVPAEPSCEAAGHDRRFVYLKKLTLQKAWACKIEGHPIHPEGSKAWFARWVCDRCQAFGSMCKGDDGDWKIEHGKMVFDEKAFANFEYPDPPKKPAEPVLREWDLPESVLGSIWTEDARPGETCL